MEIGAIPLRATARLTVVVAVAVAVADAIVVVADADADDVVLLFVVKHFVPCVVIAEQADLLRAVVAVVVVVPVLVFVFAGDASAESSSGFIA